MNLQSFSSVAEIFATFSLAYIIIDELTENPFISTVSEKILKKYTRVERQFLDVKANIAGVRASLNELASRSKINNEVYEKSIDKITRLVDATENKNEVSYSEIRGEIRESHSTRMFVFLNCYLFLYCVAILFYGGIYSSDQVCESSFNSIVDNSLGVFFICSLIYVIGGWILDRKIGKNKKGDDVFQNFLNGYLFSVIIFGIALGLSIWSFFAEWHLVKIGGNKILHPILIFATLLLPISNFLIYILKASNRAKKLVPGLINKAEIFKNDYFKELEPVHHFIGACKFDDDPPSIEKQ